MKQLSIDDNYLVPVKSNCDGELIFVGGGYEEKWYGVGEVQTLMWEEIKAIRKYKRAFFENNWVIFEKTDEYTPSQLYEALGVAKYYATGDKFKDFDEVLAMKPKEISAYLQEMTDGYREAFTAYAKGLSQNGDSRMDSKAKVTALEKVLNVDFSEV